MHRYLTTAFLIFVPLGIESQESALVGLVTDSITGAALPGARISVPDLEIESRSGQDGTFRLEGISSGEIVVFVTHADYEVWAARLQVSLEQGGDVPLGRITLNRAYHAAFFGSIADSVSGEPLAGVEISMAEADIHETTGEDGTFRLEGIRSGEHTIIIRQIGYSVWAQTIALDVTQPMQVDFGTIALNPTGAVRLAPITVEGEAFRASTIMTDFLHRMRTEKGTFFTYEDIERTNPQQTSDMLRSVPGFNVRGGGRITSRRGTAGLQSFTECTVQYFVDGIHVTSTSLDVIMPRAIAGMEVYTGSSTIPHVFRRPRLDAKCGIVAIWTKDASYVRP
jgi:hypothetical protein